jgi:hypothetical protein
LKSRPSKRSTETAAAEVTLVRSVLLDIGSLVLFRGVGMAFMFHQIFIRAFPESLPWLSLLRFSGGTDGRWHMGRHDRNPHVAGKSQVHKAVRKGKRHAKWQDYRDWPTGSGAWVLLFDWDVAPDSDATAGAFDVLAWWCGVMNDIASAMATHTHQ